MDGHRRQHVLPLFTYQLLQATHQTHHKPTDSMTSQDCFRYVTASPTTVCSATKRSGHLFKSEVSLFFTSHASIICVQHLLCVMSTRESETFLFYTPFWRRFCQRSYGKCRRGSCFMFVCAWFSRSHGKSQRGELHTQLALHMFLSLSTKVSTFFPSLRHDLHVREYFLSPHFPHDPMRMKRHRHAKLCRVRFDRI